MVPPAPNVHGVACPLTLSHSRRVTPSLPVERVGSSTGDLSVVDTSRINPGSARQRACVSNRRQRFKRQSPKLPAEVYDSVAGLPETSPVGDAVDTPLQHRVQSRVAYRFSAKDSSRAVVAGKTFDS